MKKRLQTWILIGALIASAAGAAAGTVLSGYVEGKVNVAVSQSLQTDNVTVSGIPSGRASFAAVSDAGTEFSAAVQLYQGESATVRVPIKNSANVPHVIEIIVTAPVLPVPAGGSLSDYSINLDVTGDGIPNPVRIGPNKWKGTAPSSSAVPNYAIKIEVALGDMVPPGYYEISGQIQVVAY